MAAGGSTTVIWIAMCANFGIACAKFAASVWTGSSAMLSEAIHSLVDTSNQVLLLYGLKRSNKKADAAHPFGYSKELYFWSFIVAILLFSLGAGVAIYEGIEKFFHPHPIEYPEVIYIVLGLAIGMEGFSTYKALAEFRTRYAGRKFVSALQKSKDPALFAIVLEDIAAMGGLFIALIGVLIADKLGYLQADGIASIAIGLLLASVAVFMAIEIKGLIIGEAADPEIQRGLFNLFDAESNDDGLILAINEIRTMHLGPTDILVAASVDFRDGVTAEDVEATTNRLERTIKDKYPSVRQLFIEVQSIASHEASVARENGGQELTKVAAEANGLKARAGKVVCDPGPDATSVAPEPRKPSSGSTGSFPPRSAEPSIEASSKMDPKLDGLPSNRKTRKSKRRAKKKKN